MSYVYTKFDVFVQILRVKSIKKNTYQLVSGVVFKELSSAIGKTTCTHVVLCLEIDPPKKVCPKSNL